MSKLNVNAFKESLEKGINWRTTIKSVLWSFVIAFIGITLASVLFTYSSLGENMEQLIAILIVVVSVFVGGYINAKYAGNQGWIHGALSAVLFMLVVLLVSGLVSSRIPFDKNYFIMLVAAISGGVLGGMFGVNAK